MVTRAQDDDEMEGGRKGGKRKRKRAGERARLGATAREERRQGRQSLPPGAKRWRCD